MSKLPRLAVVTAALALATAACGGGDEAALGSGADIAPPSTALFLSLNTEFDGDQWRRAQGLLRRFPAGREAALELLQELEREDVDFERDVKPAVGPEVDFVFLDLEREDAFVVLTDPEDEAKFEKLVEEGEGGGVAAPIGDGWMAAAKSQEALDRFERARGDDTLAETDAFEEAMAGLEDDALAKLWVNGARLTRELEEDEEVPPEARGAIGCFLGRGALPSFALALAAEDDGARLSGTYRAEGLDPSEGYEAELPSELPAGALLYVSFNDLAGQIRRVVRCAGDTDEDFDRALAALEFALGVSIEDDLLPLLENEGALVAYRGAGSQTGSTANEGALGLGLVTRVGDEEQALETLDAVAERAAAFTDEIRFRERDFGGVRARHISYEDFSLQYAGFDGKLVVTPSDEGILALLEEGRRLTDDRAYQRARERANAPDETSGFVYANVAEAAASLLGLADSRPEPGARENLDPLRSLFVYGTADDDTVAFEGFLAIE